MKISAFKIVLMAIVFCHGLTIMANNIQVSNLSLTGNNTTDHFALVQFDISWENSWRTTTTPFNWDAAWLFVKYRVPGGEWQHAWLNESGHTAPAGSIIAPGLLTPGAAFNASTNPGLGAFIYRSDDGTGDFTKTGVQLRWNYGDNGVTNAAVAEIKVFAIEMVYVPQGAFAAGSGGSENSKFTLTTINTGTSTTAPSGTGSLGGAAGGYPTGQSAPANASWPNGFNAIYCQKYEISQQQYVDFLNTLTQTQATIRKFDKPDPNYRYEITGSAVGSYATANPYVACNYLSWMDGAAYSDWAGLRPMTELEYEKACRGTATPVANEFAWGNTSATAANNITNPGAINETTTTSEANVVYGNQTNVQGPMRVGVFAQGATTRIQSGASYYGIMEMSGNLWERPVTVGNADGRAFTGLHGNGALSTAGHANVDAWPGLISGEVTSAAGSGFRGGRWSYVAVDMRVSNREDAQDPNSNRSNSYGFRGVRSQPPPVLTTTEVTAITATTANSGGNVTSNGGVTITVCGVCWSTTTGPTTALATKTTETGTTGVFTSNLTNLSSNTTYYVRAYATSSAGTSYGNEISFTTLLAIGDVYQGGKIAYLLQPGDPGYNAAVQKGLIAATTNQSTGIAWITGGSTQYTLNGHTSMAYGTGYANTDFMIVQSGFTGGAAKVCVDYSVTVGGVTYSDWYLPSKDELNKLYINRVAVGGFASNYYWSSSEKVNLTSWGQSFSDGLQGYDFKGASYYVRAVRSFPTLPTLTTAEVTSILSITATSGGNILDDGGSGIAARGVCWDTLPGPTIALASKTNDGTGIGTFTSSMTNINAGTVYYLRAYATNSTGTSYGNEVSFETRLIIGDYYKGGKVAYFLLPGDPGYVAGERHGLIAAADYDQSTGTQWGCQGTLIAGAGGTAIGTGNQNTIAIEAGCATAGIAADICANLVLKGYSDWYLPSKDELYKLYLNRAAIGFASQEYWSSSQADRISAWALDFRFNRWYESGTSFLGGYVRAVRSF